MHSDMARVFYFITNMYGKITCALTSVKYILSEQTTVFSSDTKPH